MGFKIAGFGIAAPGRKDAHGQVLGQVFNTEQFVTHQFNKRVTGIKSHFAKGALREVLEKAKETVKETGIVERDILYDKQVKLPNTYLCAEAVIRSLKSAGMRASEIEGFIYASDTPDFIYPSNGILVADRLGIPTDNEYSRHSLACVSFAKALKEAIGWLENGDCNNVVVVSGDITSRLQLPENLRELFLFGDGFVSLILKKDKVGSVTYSNIGVDKNLAKLFLHRPSNSGDMLSLDEHQAYGLGNDRGIATIGLCEKELWPWLTKRFTQLAGVEIDEHVKIIIPQATNGVLHGGLETYKRKTSQDIEKNVLPLSSCKHGNTGAGAIPLALIEGLESGAIKPGEKIILIIVGVGGLYTALMIDPTSEEPHKRVRLSADDDKPNFEALVNKRLQRREKTSKTKNHLSKYELQMLLQPLNPPPLHDLDQITPKKRESLLNRKEVLL